MKYVILYNHRRRYSNTIRLIFRVLFIDGGKNIPGVQWSHYCWYSAVKIRHDKY